MTPGIEALLPVLLRTLDAIAWAQRRLHPPWLEDIAGRLETEARALEPLVADAAAGAPAEAAFVAERLAEVARGALELVRGFGAAAREPQDPGGVYRTIRRFARTQEALFPLAPLLPPVSRWFLEPACRDDAARLARLRAAALREDLPTGVLHAGNDRGARGGCSLYVPEDWDGRTPRPLVVALHGGHGHGRDFLWAWVREARSRGVLVLAPTSRDRTWSLAGEDVDADAVREMVAAVGARFPVDRGRVLLTGMSDGATYALLLGLRAHSPFTHLAPVCGVLHPLLLLGGGLGRARGRPIYLVHGALDWMFPVETARLSRAALAAAGARLTYREVPDLSHTYPRDENPRILDWLASEPA